jgi:hypothetical protein
MGKYLRISSYIRKPFLQYDCSTLNFPIYEENLIFFFISVPPVQQLLLSADLLKEQLQEQQGRDFMI